MKLIFEDTENQSFKIVTEANFVISDINPDDVFANDDILKIRIGSELQKRMWLDIMQSYSDLEFKKSRILTILLLDEHKRITYCACIIRAINSDFVELQYDYVINNFDSPLGNGERGSVDLRICKTGDKLESALGRKLTYLEQCCSDNFYDHIVDYDEEHIGTGTRTHDGYVFRMNRIPDSDHDIVKIIPC